MPALPRVFLLGALLSVCVSGVAQEQLDTTGETSGVRAVSLADYRAHVERLQTLVQACRKDAGACDSKKVGDDERVEGEGFEARWSWLREAIASAHDAGLQGREKTLQEAASRLDEDAALASDDGAAKAASGLERARKGADDILARPEFRTVTEESYVQREIAAIAGWLERAFGGVSRFGKRSPWVLPLIEWGAIALAAVGVLIWMWRSMRRQRLAVLLQTSFKAEIWRKESDDWAELARVEAERQEWREAVHCLYWATIVMMEGRRLWRQNRARTPREYLLLLESGSAIEHSLRRLALIFERIWYGVRPAAESDYQRALALFEELRVV